MTRQDVYGVYRSGIRPIGRDGLVRPVSDGGTYDVRLDLTAAREVVRWVLLIGSLDREDARFARKARGWIDQACADHLIGKDTVGMGPVLARLQRLAVAAPMPADVTVAAIRIRDHMRLYAKAWKGFGMLLRHHLNGKKPEPASVMHAASELEKYRAAFQAVRERPYCRNASHAERDMDAAIRACVVFDHVAARACLVRARRGLRWVFLLHYLHKEVLTPFSFLLARAVNRNRAGPAKDRRIVLYKEFEPPRFRAIRKRLDCFRKRLERCSDENFTEPVKTRVRAAIDMAKAAMDAHDWPRAKLHLVRASRIL